MIGRNPRPALGRIILIAGFLLSTQVASAATQGVALDPGRVDVTEPLESGASYLLTVLFVRNPGTTAGVYHMTAKPDASESDGVQGIATEWIAFNRETFELDPQELIEVDVTLQLPDDVIPGTYKGLLEVRVTGDEPERSGASVGVGAATTIQFDVVSSDLLDDIRGLRLGERFNEFQPWSTIFTVLLLLVVAWSVARRRFRFSVKIERRE